MSSDLKSLFIHSFELFLFNLKFVDFPEKMFYSRITIWHCEVVSTLCKHSIAFLDHLSHIHQGIVRTHKWVNCRFIDNEVKLPIFVLHFSHIHHVKNHLIVSLLLGCLWDLLDSYGWDVIVEDKMVSILVEIILNAAVATTDVQDVTLLAFGQTKFKLRLSGNRCTLRRE